MKILIASDKFKGSLSAREACEAIAAGLRGDHEIRILPIADGGEGFTTALVEACDGALTRVETVDALGRAHIAEYGLLENGATAVIEMSAASGIESIAERDLDPWSASTYGTGLLISAAMNRGVTKILLGLGGSATNDGGTGLAEALGFRFFDEQKNIVTGLPKGLESVHAVETPEQTFPEVLVACDVENPLLGASGSTRVYGPQKGVEKSTMARQEARLEKLSDLFPDISPAIPGCGAAGGLGFGAIAFLEGRLVPGFQLIADAVGMSEKIAWADLVITGEGRLDPQSLSGKGPYGTIQMARRAGKKTITFCGTADDEVALSPFGTIVEIADHERSLAENLQNGRVLLTAAAKKLNL